ncbi:hypothetical protein TVAG_412610 [Trichomonas vaginalis G3]|uniref:Uncharacterized protein n=1 Tax=Trichomonas vaginalis (strain ATCC PRA-98 / G3) TaxID=412133 RepID=A2EV74_TRIV3|nr:hypothetical protein TVAGG3_0936120 [Trichomonas vaginalis G3]EAY03457.1 hypothetical protein TVAG_412610 [Trichomonas vaginalis G3]KAI5486191.1 hypothetical protein TVAGG3_0936120 [Trichomonas vaginalis G3]|eukprot:XP_001315680.1 hypothetical protein [Trichomonas vaginalis G3]
MSVEKDIENKINIMLTEITEKGNSCKLKAVIDKFSCNEEYLDVIGIKQLKELDYYQIDTSKLCKHWKYIGKTKKDVQTGQKVQQKTLNDYIRKIKIDKGNECIISYQKLEYEIQSERISNAFGFLGNEAIEHCLNQYKYCTELIDEFEQFNKQYDGHLNEESICQYLSEGDEKTQFGIKTFIDDFFGESCTKYGPIFYEILFKFGPKDKIKENFTKLIKPDKYELYNWIQFGKSLTGEYKCPVVRPSSSNPFAFKVDTGDGRILTITRDFNDKPNSYVLNDNEKVIEGTGFRDVLEKAGLVLHDIDVGKEIEKNFSDFFATYNTNDF